MTADELVRRLRLQPHPEGGHYRRLYTSARRVAHRGHERAALSAIRYLLARGQRSRWHRIDADEVWHWQSGGPLELLRFDESRDELARVLLGAGPGMRRAAVVPAGAWQAAHPLDGHALLLCTVSPGFAWQGFELLEGGSAVAAELRTRDVFH
ncbi:cupin domain-containing protein [Luteimonas salinilitoris]|uniref:Cupin domain-containing protein n=1 Tax=Luteimonas salinilitoris TaxID=3237697 RepID=A0ABV4HQ59_9GAMM